ncbi:fungal-specific transcription factor domain-containing protein [Mycena maculata]|uniref:Fungal-specific transcription factor domain-containing protein n=1 Tax=Mycena maculata TaxID=230809 RepID=A0AAD7JZH1_9AGAR|nr:fungal-specific transcription factor domain-containing protein [Mycena maculata]
MSSSDEEIHEATAETLGEKQSGRGPQKKRRLQRSCDICRKRKIRCDSASMPGGRCSSCIAFNAECTHTEPTRKRGPKNKHVEELKQQLSALEAKLRTVQPDGTPTSAATSVIKYPVAQPPNDATPTPPPLPEEDLSHDELAERFRAFSLGAMKHRFFGSSSGFMLVKNAIAVKEDFLGRRLATSWRRPEFWNIRPWEERSNEDTPRYVFPAQDLIASLVDLYFTNVHPTLPLLHRPSFERSVAEGLHLENYMFGATLLAVLAVASRYSDDPRVFVPGSNSTLSSGWMFFDQVQIVRKSLFDEPSIYEVQLYCLITLFTLGTSSPQASWLYLGLGVRFIQERGEHRRKRDGSKPTAENELWKRAFWSLLSLDRTVCSFLGRPSAIHVEDYDVELPLEVDDEYWEHPDPEQAFKQPPGKPSLLTYFICHIRLCEILGSTLRRLYASNKSRLLMGLVGHEWEQRAVAELDSAMNEFLGSLPEHLRWNPKQTGVFFDQSALLHAMYYSLQITIHRPYIHKPNLLTLPSLAICTSAARSCIHVCDMWLDKLQHIGLPHMQTAVFISGIVLLLNLFGLKRAGLPIDVGKELSHVTTASRILKFFELRWQTAGRLWELLQELQAWEGPPPAKHAPKESTAPQETPATELHPADMCPMARKALEESQAAGAVAQETSIFTDPAPAEEGTTFPGNLNPFFATVADELSSYSMQQQLPSMDIWNDPPSNPHSSNQAQGNPTAAQRAEMTIDQLIASAAVYDDATGLAKSMDQWSSSTGLASMMVDDDLMSLWTSAPTGFANLADWDTYIETKSGAGVNFAANFDPRLTPSSASSSASSSTASPGVGLSHGSMPNRVPVEQVYSTFDGSSFWRSGMNQAENQ